MHLKNNTSKKGSAEEADSVILETDSTQDTIENAFEGLGAFFTSLNPKNIDSSTSAIRDINSESPPLADGSLIIKSLQENECVFRNDLNNCVYLRCELYKGSFKIYIRKFLIIESDVKPTFNGVAMNLHSCFDFFRKIFNFNLLYSSSSFVANNNILVTNTNSQMIVKNLQTNAWIALDDDQLNNLKHCAHDLNEELIDYLYSNYLPKVILKNYTPNCEKINDQLSLMKSLIVSIEESVLKYPRNLESTRVSSRGIGNDSKMMVMGVDVTAQVAPELQRRMRTGIWQLLPKETEEHSIRSLSRQLSSATGTTVSRQTVYRLLRHIGLYARSPVRCVPLTATHCRLRLTWSREHALWTPQQWSCVMFSDESRFSLQSDSRRILI
ncbi:HTH_Tnp_Tc3_2 domain-containing protein [Trichonephila clavipes]|nr:HTH_Tnp_Tc3_2 domain-containing protein [Trichonephila clavipes]